MNYDYWERRKEYDKKRERIELIKPIVFSTIMIIIFCGLLNI